MTTPERLERGLPSILSDLAMGPTPEYLDDVFSRTGRMRQRPAWTFPERWLPMADITRSRAFVPSAPWRLIAVALLLLALIAGALLVVGSQQRRLPAPFGPAANGLITYAAGGDIYAGDPVTGETRLVVGGAEADSAPGYSPDGTLIAFIREVSATEVDLYVVRPDGSDLRRLTSAPIPNDSWANWAPDSKHIATIRQALTTGCAVTICFTSQLDLMDVTDGSTRTITTADGMDYVQFRPPDANQLMYRARMDGEWGLFAIDVDGTNMQTLATPIVPGEMDLSFSGATYSADGSQIFYEHGDQSGCCRLWVMNADGSDPHEFLPRGPAWDGQAVVSPDGTRIAYWHVTDTGKITVVRTDGTGPVVEISPPLVDTAHWAWSPDSTKILMFPNDVETGSAYLLDPHGGPATNVPWVSSGDFDWQRVALPD